MKILVAYVGKTGTTAKAAAMLSECLIAKGAKVSLVDLALSSPSLDGYDAAAVGGSIRIGRLHKLARRYLTQNAAKLEALPFGIFCCRCGQDDTKALLKSQLPETLLTRAADVASFGGELDMALQKGLDRLVVGMISKSDQSQAMRPTGLLPQRVQTFADALTEAIAHD